MRVIATKRRGDLHFARPPSPSAIGHARVRHLEGQLMPHTSKEDACRPATPPTSSPRGRLRRPRSPRRRARAPHHRSPRLKMIEGLKVGDLVLRLGTFSQQEYHGIVASSSPSRCSPNLFVDACDSEISASSARNPCMHILRNPTSPPRASRQARHHRRLHQQSGPDHSSHLSQESPWAEGSVSGRGPAGMKSMQLPSHPVVMYA